MTTLPEVLAALPGDLDLTPRPDGSVQITTWPVTERAVTLADGGDGYVLLTRYVDDEEVDGEELDETAEAAGYVTGHLQRVSR